MKNMHAVVRIAALQSTAGPAKQIIADFGKSAMIFPPLSPWAIPRVRARTVVFKFALTDCVTVRPYRLREARGDRPSEQPQVKLV